MSLQPALAFAWNPAVGVPLLIAGIVVLALLWLFGQPKKEQQGRRRQTPGQNTGGGERLEPTFGQNADTPSEGELSFSATDTTPTGLEETAPARQGELDVGLREELERLGATLSGNDKPKSNSIRSKLAGQAASIVDALRAPSSPDSGGDKPVPTPVSRAAAPAAAMSPAPQHSDVGRRPAQLAVERIVSLFVVAREGATFNGSDLIVAAEKAGLEYGDMGIYHRLVDGKRELGPIFSVANMLKPGSFDLTHLDTLRTPGLSFFMTLPAPLPALDAWDTMLPTAQRLAELLDGQVLDEERNALGRQRIAHIRDELRGWDRGHEGEEIHFGR